MEKEYFIEKTKEGIELNRSNLRDTNLTFREGLCAANIENVTQPLDSEWYKRNILVPMINCGILNDGSNGNHDDRKIRYDGCSMKEDVLEVALGTTHYLAFKADFNRNDNLNRILQNKGLHIFSNLYAFFSRPVGVAGLLFSKEGSLIIGKRKGGEDENILCSIAGHTEYNEDPAKLDLAEEIKRELKEETGLEARAMIKRPEFIGVYVRSTIGDPDFAYILQTDVPEKYFSGGQWKEQAKDVEHKDFIKIPSFAEVRLLLETGKIKGYREQFKLHYSLQGMMESLTERDFV